MRAIAAIPSLEAGADELMSLVGALQSAGVEPVIVANSATLAARAEKAKLPFITEHRNLGFGESIRQVASESGWDMLVIANDDLVIDAPVFAEFWSGWSATDSIAGISYLCPEPPRRVPRRWETFLSLSLLGKVFRRDASTPGSGTQTYQSFSMVSVTRDTWDRLDGLDPSIPFTYEDSDFVRRALDAGIRCETRYDTGVTHRHSVTTGRHISSVLPVSAWSALAYLNKWYGSHRLNVLLIVTALVLRVPLAPFTRAKLGEHLRGIRSAIRAVTSRQRPELPDYGTNAP